MFVFDTSKLWFRGQCMNSSTIRTSIRVPHTKATTIFCFLARYSQRKASCLSYRLNVLLLLVSIFQISCGSTTNNPNLSGASKALVTTPVQLTIASSVLQESEVGATYAALLSAIGGTKPYYWTLTAGTLPAGLELQTLTGAITGMASIPGNRGHTSNRACKSLQFESRRQGPCCESPVVWFCTSDCGQQRGISSAYLALLQHRTRDRQLNWGCYQCLRCSTQVGIICCTTTRDLKDRYQEQQHIQTVAKA